MTKVSQPEFDVNRKDEYDDLPFEVLRGADLASVENVPDVPRPSPSSENGTTPGVLCHDLSDLSDFSRLLTTLEDPASRDSQGASSDDDLHEFLKRAAMESQNEAMLLDEDRRDAPDNETGKWRSRTWGFAARCKGRLEYMSLRAEEWSHKIEEYGWERLGFDEEDRIQAEIEWSRCRLPAGYHALEHAWHLAEERQLVPLAGVLKGSLEKLMTTLACLSWIKNGDYWKRGAVPKPVAAPQDRLADLMGCSQQRVSKLITIALTRGYLKLIRHAQRRVGNRRGRAAEYEFISARFRGFKRREAS